MQAFLEKYEALTERMRHVEKGQGGYASRRQAATRGLETAGRDAVCAVSLVEGRERDWSGEEVAFGSSTEGHKDHISKRKTQNAKRKTQKQPHMAPRPINYFFSDNSL
jgi:hypothetical protein